VAGDQMQIRRPLEGCNDNQVLPCLEQIENVGHCRICLEVPSYYSPTGHKTESGKLYRLAQDKAEGG
jgi:hypothetical protein